MIIIEKEKRLKWLNFKNQKYFYLDFCNVTALITVLAVTVSKTNQVVFVAVNSFSIIIIIIIIIVIIIIINNLLYYLFDLIFSFIIIWHLLCII